MDRRRAAGALLALAACFATSAAAPTASNQTALDLYEGNTEGCYYNFQHYGEGDRIMTNEPCLNCTCHNRMLMCYLRVCPFTKAIGQDCTVEKRADQCCPIVTCPDVPVDLLTSTSTSSPAEYGGTGVGRVDNYGCSINGKYFPEGAKVPPTPNKPCEHCYCIRNMTTCVMQECTLHVDGCTPIYHKDVCCPVRYFCDHPEDEIPLLDDMTTTVRPTPGFILTTTTPEATTISQTRRDCIEDDQLYPDGALIKTEKPCVHCYCMKGDIVCVVQECGTPMENEGKNCSSLPPREGQCCPDTYICEGDEVTTELIAETPYQEITTISPPRRFSVEGSGYRIEPDESPYTEIPTYVSEIEGSGEEEQASIRPIDSSELLIPEHQTTPESIDEKFTTSESVLEYKPSTTIIPTEEHENVEQLTTEPDKGQNTVPSGIYDEDSTGPSIVDKTTSRDETKTTLPGSDSELNIVSADSQSTESSVLDTTTFKDNSETEHSIPPTEKESIFPSEDKVPKEDGGKSTETVPSEHTEESSESPMTERATLIEEVKTTMIDTLSETTEKQSSDSVEAEKTTLIDELGVTEPSNMFEKEEVTTSKAANDELIGQTTSRPIDQEQVTEQIIPDMKDTIIGEEKPKEETAETVMYQTTTVRDEMVTTEPAIISGQNTIPSGTDPTHEITPYNDKELTTPRIETMVTQTTIISEQETVSSDVTDDQASIQQKTTMGEVTETTKATFDIEPQSKEPLTTVLDVDITTEGAFIGENDIQAQTEKVVEKTTPEMEEVKTAVTTEFVDTSASTEATVSETSKQPQPEIEDADHSKLTTESILELSSFAHETEKESDVTIMPGSSIEPNTQTTFIIDMPETTTINLDKNEIDEDVSQITSSGRIPGEGDCLLNGITYSNDSVVPSTNKCHSGCRCASSIIKCDPIICSPPPEYMDNCQLTYDTPNACCPTYVCDHSRETIPPQPHSQMSGTESPLPSPSIECIGDECQLDEKIEPSASPTDNMCTSGSCLDGPGEKPEPSTEDQKPEGCPNGKCIQPSEICAEDKCHLQPSKESSQEIPSQPCENPEDCKVIKLPHCEGDSCKDQALQDKLCEGDSCEIKHDKKDDSQICTNQDDCTQKQIPEVSLPPCEGETCTSAKDQHCNSESGCADSGDKSCTGENCKGIPESTPTQNESQICDADGSCTVINISEPQAQPCNGESCTSSVSTDDSFPPQTEPIEVCANEAECKKPDEKDTTGCTSEDCKNKPDSGEGLQQECLDPECAQDIPVVSSQEPPTVKPEQNEGDQKLPEIDVTSQPEHTDAPELLTISPQETTKPEQSDDLPDSLFTLQDVSSEAPATEVTQSQEISPQEPDFVTELPVSESSETVQKVPELETTLQPEVLVTENKQHDETVVTSDEFVTEKQVPDKLPESKPVDDDQNIGTEDSQQGELVTPKSDESLFEPKQTSTYGPEFTFIEKETITELPQSPVTDNAVTDHPESTSDIDINQTELPSKETITELNMLSSDSTKVPESSTSLFDTTEKSTEAEPKVTEAIETDTKAPEISKVPETAASNEMTTESTIGLNTLMSTDITVSVEQYTSKKPELPQSSIKPESKPDETITVVDITTKSPEQVISDNETIKEELATESLEPVDNITMVPEIIDTEEKQSTESPKPPVTQPEASLTTETEDKQKQPTEPPKQDESFETERPLSAVTETSLAPEKSKTDLPDFTEKTTLTETIVTQAIDTINETPQSTGTSTDVNTEVTISPHEDGITEIPEIPETVTKILEETRTELPEPAITDKVTEIEYTKPQDETKTEQPKIDDTNKTTEEEITKPEEEPRTEQPELSVIDKATEAIVTKPEEETRTELPGTAVTDRATGAEIAKLGEKITTEMPEPVITDKTIESEVTEPQEETITESVSGVTYTIIDTETTKAQEEIKPDVPELPFTNVPIEPEVTKKPEDSVTEVSQSSVTVATVETDFTEETLPPTDDDETEKDTTKEQDKSSTPQPLIPITDVELVTKVTKAEEESRRTEVPTSDVTETPLKTEVPETESILPVSTVTDVEIETDVTEMQEPVSELPLSTIADILVETEVTKAQDITRGTELPVGETEVTKDQGETNTEIVVTIVPDTKVIGLSEDSTTEQPLSRVTNTVIDTEITKLPEQSKTELPSLSVTDTTTHDESRTELPFSGVTNTVIETDVTNALEETRRTEMPETAVTGAHETKTDIPKPALPDSGPEIVSPVPENIPTEPSAESLVTTSVTEVPVKISTIDEEQMNTETPELHDDVSKISTEAPDNFEPEVATPTPAHKETEEKEQSSETQPSTSTERPFSLVADEEPSKETLLSDKTTSLPDLLTSISESITKAPDSLVTDFISSSDTSSQEGPKTTEESSVTEQKGGVTEIPIRPETELSNTTTLPDISDLPNMADEYDKTEKIAEQTTEHQVSSAAEANEPSSSLQPVDQADQFTTGQPIQTEELEVTILPTQPHEKSTEIPQSTIIETQDKPIETSNRPIIDDERKTEQPETVTEIQDLTTTQPSTDSISDIDKIISSDKDIIGNDRPEISTTKEQEVGTEAPTLHDDSYQTESTESPDVLPTEKHELPLTESPESLVTNLKDQETHKLTTESQTVTEQAETTAPDVEHSEPQGSIPVTVLPEKDISGMYEPSTVPDISVKVEPDSDITVESEPVTTSSVTLDVEQDVNRTDLPAVTESNRETQEPELISTERQIVDTKTETTESIMVEHPETTETTSMEASTKLPVIKDEATIQPEHSTERLHGSSETTPYSVELQQHTHKIDEDISTQSVEHLTEQPDNLVTEQDQRTESSTVKLPSDEMFTGTPVENTEKPDGDKPEISPVEESYSPEIPEKSTETSVLTTEQLEIQEIDHKYTTDSISVQSTEISYSTVKSVEEERSTPATSLETEKPFDLDEQTTTKPEKEIPQSTIKPFIVEDTTAPEEEFIPAKVTTTKAEEEISTQTPESLDKFTKPEEKPNEVAPSTSVPEKPTPGSNELQPTDEVPLPEDELSPTGGYNQEPDYVEEDQAFGPGTCRYGGKVYVSAQQIPRDDPCDFCFCFRSDIICLQQSCPPPIHGCHEEPIQGFCCPRYECPVSMATTLNVTTTTTTTTTTLPPHFLPHAYKGAAQRRGCQIKGHTYKVGEVVRASSGPCLHCTCGGDGQMKCDPKACTPEPMLRQMIAAAVSAKRRR